MPHTATRRPGIPHAASRLRRMNRLDPTTASTNPRIRVSGGTTGITAEPRSGPSPWPDSGNPVAALEDMVVYTYRVALCTPGPLLGRTAMVIARPSPTAPRSEVLTAAAQPSAPSAWVKTILPTLSLITSFANVANRFSESEDGRTMPARCAMFGVKPVPVRTIVASHGPLAGVTVSVLASWAPAIETPRLLNGRVITTTVGMRSASTPQLLIPRGRPFASMNRPYGRD